MAEEVEVREERASSESDQDTNLNEAMEEEERKTKRKKRLLREAEKADKRGVCYLSRVPPHMDPKKLRQILSPYGEIQRLYLTPENPAAQMRRKKSGGFRGKEFSEGWVEFTDKKVAKRVAKMLNGEQIGGRKRSSFYYDLWNIKYLSKFKWDDLTEEIAIKNASREQKLALELSAAKRERDFYLKKVEQSKALSKIEERLKKKQKIEMVPKVMRQFSQKKPVANDTGKEKAQLSKDILAGVFGRINDDGLSINCNDQGVPFSIAKTENLQKLSDILKNPDPKLARKLQPCELTWLSELGPGSSVVMIQVTRFHCGGFALGAAFWHKIVDAVTVGHFLKCWAHTALGSGKEPVCPNYISQYLFPRIQEGGEVPRGTFMRRGKSIMRRYLIDAAAISTLKSELSSNINRPSRVEVVSALIWRCFMIASLANGKSTSIVGHVVDLRRRARPPFPSDCFGNLILSAFTSCANIEINNKSGVGELLVEKLRTSISKIDGEYIDRVVTDEGLPELIMEHIGQTLVGIDLERADYLAFSSWCNFGLYDIDFGWGKPVWINSSDHSTFDEESNFLNEVCLMDSRFGDGVEAWVTLDETYMEIFDSVEELRAVACKDPAPI